MNDLQLAQPRERGVLPALLIAVVVLAAAAVAIFYFNPHSTAELAVTHVDTFAPQTTFGAMEGAGASTAGTHVIEAPTTSTENDLYVVATLKLTDKLRLPLFVTGAVAHVTLADGAETEITALSAADVKRLEVIFPALGKQVTQPFEDGAEVDPKQTLNTQVVLPLPGQTAAAWAGKKAATLTITLRNQGPQTTQLP